MCFQVLVRRGYLKPNSRQHKYSHAMFVSCTLHNIHERSGFLLYNHIKLSNPHPRNTQSAIRYDLDRKHDSWNSKAHDGFVDYECVTTCDFIEGGTS
jgi:hypothetical protein